MPHLPPQKAGGHADGRLPMVLRVRRLPRDTKAKAGGLLCLLLLWFSEVPPDTGGSFLLRVKFS